MMDDQQRARYHGRWWPDACQAKGWRVKDEVRRREVALQCMQQVRGPLVTSSHPSWGDNETTALRTYLEFLANPSSLTHSQRWVDCQTDYVAFNLAKVADWHQRQAYGKGGGKLTKNRFAGAPTAQGEPQETFDPAAARKRHLTMVTRNRKKTGYRASKQPAGDLRAVVMGVDLASGPDKAMNVIVDAKGRPVSPPEHLDENCPF